MKKHVLFLIALFAICLHGNAQFSYSVNAGWDFPNTHNYDNISVSSGFTFGGDIYYGLNPYLNLRSGLRYHYVKEKAYPEWVGGIYSLENEHVSSLEIPLLMNFRTQKEIKHWTAVWGAGFFGGFPFEKKRDRSRDDEKMRPYGGVIVSAQLEIRYHYILRGEYQWYLSSDLKDDSKIANERRITRFTVVAGYRF